MSTRCFIGILEGFADVRGIYCHHDGYPAGVGAMLRAHYTEPSKVKALLDLGDISALESSPEKSIAYHRDLGEKLFPNKVYKGYEALLIGCRKDFSAEYAYVYVGDSWKVFPL